MFSPLKGALRRTNYEGVEIGFGLSEKEYTVHANIGYVQVQKPLPLPHPSLFVSVD